MSDHDLDSRGWTRAGSDAVTRLMNFAAMQPSQLEAGATLRAIEEIVRAVDAAGYARGRADAEHEQRERERPWLNLGANRR